MNPPSQFALDSVRASEGWSEQSGRGKRVVLFALLLAVLNWYDLTKTLQAFQAGVLYEANPVALYILETYGSFGISIFKTFLVASAMAAFVLGRELRVAELGSLATSLIYAGVAWLWLSYPFDLL